MSINFANVKAITIPEGSVKSIASGGVTLWQLAPQTTTYRLLDYIKFSGNEYILTDHKPSNNRYYALAFEIAAKTNDRFIFAAGGDATTNGGMRCTVRTSSSYFQRRYGRNSSSNGNIGTTCNINTYYQLRFRIYEDYSAAFQILNDQGTAVGSATATASAFTSANMNTFGIMGYGQGSYAGNLSQGKVYGYYYKIGDNSGEFGCRAYPVQRKSDGRCGLYDTVNNVFFPMEGAQITWSAAGSTVTEEWTPGGYTPSTDPGVVIPQADWSDNTYENFYYITTNNAFYTALNTAAPGSNVRVKLTASVYNPTEDKTYTSTAVNTLTWDADEGAWRNYTFNISLQYNSTGSYRRIPTLWVRNGGTAGSTGDTTQLCGTDLTDLYNTDGCNLTGNVIMEFIGVA